MGESDLKIVVNGKEAELQTSRDIQQALVELGYEGAHFAVALNEDFVPRAEYSQTTIQEGDKLEVLSPIRGG